MLSEEDRGKQKATAFSQLFSLYVPRYILGGAGPESTRAACAHGPPDSPLPWHPGGHGSRSAIPLHAYGGGSEVAAAFDRRTDLWLGSIQCCVGRDPWLLIFFGRIETLCKVVLPRVYMFVCLRPSFIQIT